MLFWFHVKSTAIPSYVEARGCKKSNKSESLVSCNQCMLNVSVEMLY